jgi:hypothetical protein
MQQQRLTTVGDYLINSLTAQSLDLPPAVRHLRLPALSRCLACRMLVAPPLYNGCPCIGLPCEYCCRRHSGGRSIAAMPTKPAR